jgi:hypothetical protein
MLTFEMKDDWSHARKAKTIVETVLKNADKDGDGQVSLAEFEQAGLGALPHFEELGAAGHHYDVESGTYFLSIKLIQVNLILCVTLRILPSPRGYVSSSFL